MKDKGFKPFWWGFTLEQTDGQTDICEKFDLSLTILGGKFLHFSDYSDGQFRLIIFII